MFNNPLSVTARAPKPKPVPKPKPLPTAQELNITYNRNDRGDIDCAGYKGYLFHFVQTGEVGDKECEQLIISGPDMDAAIRTFEQCFFRGDYYKNAVFTVERMAIDLRPDRTERVVMTY